MRDGSAEGFRGGTPRKIPADGESGENGKPANAPGKALTIFRRCATLQGMEEMTYKSEYFSPAATLECGQVFRFFRDEERGGYFFFSADKACFLREEGEVTRLVCEDGDRAYFENLFDVNADAAALVEEAKSFGVPFLSRAAEFSKGLRILRQDRAECFLSFVLSQQNNIPRIRKMLFALCAALGGKKKFLGRDYFSFPALPDIAAKDVAFYRALGFGYRAKYIPRDAEMLLETDFSALGKLWGEGLKKALVAYPGVGNKVADCIALFAFGDKSAFPVDTWVERLYREDFGGRETDRAKINRFFSEKFGEHAGVFQQYLFYYKRETERG